jgi:subtilisin family serine protease
MKYAHLLHSTILIPAVMLCFGAPADAARLNTGPETFSRRMLSDRIVVLPREGTSTMLIQAHAQRLGAQVDPEVGPVDATEQELRKLGMMTMRVNADSFYPSLNAMAARADVRAATPVYEYRIQATPNDPQYNQQYHHPLIGSPTAWNTTTGSRSITIAIVDTGVDSNHADLRTNMIAGYNFVDNNTNAADVEGHGTTVAGTAAAVANNAAGVAGVNWVSSVMPLRVATRDGRATSTRIAAAITWAADRGAKVINCSFGPLQGDRTIETAARYAYNRGALVFVAQGNEGQRNPTPSIPEMIFVSATGSTDTLTSFSTWGPAVKFAAPGQGIRTTANGGSYATVAGTSFSSPMAAGLAALVWAANPSLRNADVERIMQTTAVDRGAAGRDEQYGYGRINAAGAVAAARTSTPAPTPTPTPTPTPAPSTPANITSPVPGTVLPSTTVTFRWAAATGATNYSIDLSRSPGGKELLSRTLGNATSVLISNLGNTGRILYVRLWTQVGTVWSFRDHIYTEVCAAGAAVINSPAPGSTFGGSSQLFRWNAVSGVINYRFELGSTAGGAQYGSFNLGTSTGITITGIPEDGRLVYVTLVTNYSNRSLRSTFVYTCRRR